MTRQGSPIGWGCPDLELLVQGELDCDMADAHQTRSESLVERLEPLGLVDGPHSVERVPITPLVRILDRLRLQKGNGAALEGHRESEEGIGRGKMERSKGGRRVSSNRLVAETCTNSS